MQCHCQAPFPFFKKVSPGLKTHRSQEGMRTELHQQRGFCLLFHILQQTRRSQEHLAGASLPTKRIILKNDIQNILLYSSFHSLLNRSLDLITTERQIHLQYNKDKSSLQLCFSSKKKVLTPNGALQMCSLVKQHKALDEVPDLVVTENQKLFQFRNQKFRKEKKIHNRSSREASPRCWVRVVLGRQE